MKLGIYIDDSQRRGSAQEPYTYPEYVLSYLPLTIYCL